MRCCIVIVEEHGTEEGFGDVCYDSHDFLFDHDEEYARFLKLVHGGQELAGLYHQNLRKVLITGVLVRGRASPCNRSVIILSPNECIVSERSR